MQRPRRGMYRRGRHFRVRTLDVVGIVAVSLAITAAVLLQRGGRGGEVGALAEYAGEAGAEPAAFAAAAAAAHRVVLLGDQPGAAAPKRLAADAVEALVRGRGLSALVLELSVDDQPAIDRYLATEPEDVASLLANLRSLQEPSLVAGEYVALLRRVWELNREVDPARQVRIIAADLPDWPPAHTLSPRAATRIHADRNAHMAARVDEAVLAPDPTARVLVFVSNPHVLNATGRIQAGLGAPVTVEWLGARLRARYPGEVFTIFVDTGLQREGAAPFRLSASTRFADDLRRRLPERARAFGVPVDARFDFLAEPVSASGMPGLGVDPLPRDARMSDVVDGYVFLGARRSGAQPN